MASWRTTWTDSQPRDLGRLIEIFDERPRLEFATVTNDVNLGSADGRTMARITVPRANKSSHDTSRRIKRKHQELAQQGKANGGPARYGWQKDDRNKVDPLLARPHTAETRQTRSGMPDRNGGAGTRIIGGIRAGVQPPTRVLRRTGPSQAGARSGRVRVPSPGTPALAGQRIASSMSTYSRPTRDPLLTISRRSIMPRISASGIHSIRSDSFFSVGGPSHVAPSARKTWCCESVIPLAG